MTHFSAAAAAALHFLNNFRAARTLAAPRRFCSAQQQQRVHPMLSSSFPYFSGNTELTVGMVNDLLDQMRRQSRLMSAPPVEVRRVGDGWQISYRGRKGVWAICGGHEGAGWYRWQEAMLSAESGWVPKPQGRDGTGDLAAKEVGGRDDVTPGTILWLQPIDGQASGVDAFGFTAPLSANNPRTLMWAKILSTDGKTYGWIEQYFDGDQFVTPTTAISAVSGDDKSAVEVSGASVPVDAIVLLSHDPENAEETRLFEYASSGDGGFWARLVRESTGAEYTANLASPSGGTWTLTFDPGDTPAPGTSAGTVTAQFDDDASTVQAALDEFTAGDVTVSSDGGGFTFTFGGNLSGESGATLSCDFSLSSGSGSAASEPDFSRTVIGRDLPFTVGKGQYAWQHASFNTSGRLAADGTSSSVWPVCLARESRGITTVPEGAVVWVRPGRTGLKSLDTAKADPGFDSAWSDDDITAHFSAIDNGDGTITDSGVDFVWWGECSFWGELTDAPDSDGGFPFRVVHLGGNEVVEQTALQKSGSVPDFSPNAIAELQKEFLSDDYGCGDPLTGAVYVAELQSPTEGTWDITFTAGDSPAPDTFDGTATVEFDATADDIKTALDIYTNKDVVVTESPGGFTFTFVGALAIQPTATLEATFAFDSPDASPSASETKTAPTLTRTETSGQVWVPSRPGGREITGVARDVVGRIDYRAGTVVRIFPAPVGSRPLFWFSGSPTDLWATLTGEVGGGVYNWKELDPPFDPETGAAMAARTGTATEGLNQTGIADDTVVLLHPGGATGYRFRHQLLNTNGDCRLLHWTTGSTATIVAGPDDPDSNGRVVNVQFRPQELGDSLTPPGHHIGFKPPGASYYVITVPYGFSTDRCDGYFTTGDQLVPGRWCIGQGAKQLAAFNNFSTDVGTVGQGGLIVTGTGTTSTIVPPTAWRGDISVNVGSLYVTGQTILTNDGSLQMSDGPKLVASGNMCDLRGAGWWTSPRHGLLSGEVIGAGGIYGLDGYPVNNSATGTFPLAARGNGTPGSVTFKGGLFISATAPTASSAMFTGSFSIGAYGVTQAIAPLGFANVVDGVIVSFT